MARGHNDYGVPDYSFFAVETPISDIIAERQGFSRLDNRGRVLLFDDFRSGINRWVASYDDPLSIPKHIYDTGKAIGYYGSILCDPVVEGSYSGVYQKLLLPVSKRLGFEASIYLTSNFGNVFFRLEHNYSASVIGSADIGIAYQTGAVRIDGSNGWEAIVTPANVNYFLNRWVSIKVVVDFEVSKFVRLMIGNTQYDISNHSINSGQAGFVGATHAEFWIEGSTATYLEAGYLGYIVISGDEP